MTTGENLFLQGKIDEAFKALQDDLTGRNCYLLGLILREGLGHQKADEEKAEQYFKKGKAMGDPLCGLSLFAGEKDKEMWDTVNQDFSRVLLAAQAGDVLAMDEAGLFYTNGGILFDYEEGMKWLAKGAFYEYWKALYDLGLAYAGDYPGYLDDEKAKVCFRKASQFNDKNSEYELAQILYTELGHEGEALKLMEKSSDHGNEDAAMFLAEHYGNDARPHDFHKSFHWYETAARMGCAEAVACLAWFYEKGRVVPQNLKKAADLLKDSYTMGNKEALFSLGLFYLDHGQEENAVPWLEASTANQNERAAYLLGMMYLHGKGIEADREKGIGYLTIAANLGSLEADDELRRQGGMFFG